jgi:hypothetical protein
VSYPTRQQNHQTSVCLSQDRTFCLALQNNQLRATQGILGDEVALVAPHID